MSFLKVYYNYHKFYLHQIRYLDCFALAFFLFLLFHGAWVCGIKSLLRDQSLARKKIKFIYSPCASNTKQGVKKRSVKRTLKARDEFKPTETAAQSLQHTYLLVEGAQVSVLPHTAKDLRSCLYHFCRVSGERRRKRWRVTFP